MDNRPHRVADDPGLHFVKDPQPAIDAPPDSDIDPAPEALWPPAAVRSGICGAVTPNVVPWPGGGYRMYYTQILPRPGFPAGANDYDQSTTRILSAWSGDGAVWTPEPGVRLTPQAGGAGEYRVVSPEVVPVSGDSGRWRMYFECCAGPQAAGSTLRSAVSEDGLAWVVEDGVRLGGAGSYNSPRVVYLDDGRCRLYCGTRAEGIASAVSEDGGLTFAREEGMRIRPEPGYDALTAFAPEVLQLPGGDYRLYYAGYSASNCAYVLSALSADGLAWHKEPEPVVAPGGAWDGAKCSEMCIAELPDTCYRLFYEACDGTAVDERGVWRIASASAG